MAAEFFICGRRALPAHAGEWELELESDEGGVWLREAADEPNVSWAAAIVGWTPAAVVRARKAWEHAQAASEALATMLEGVVFCDVDCAVFFDAEGKGAPAASMEELESRVRDAFEHPEPYFARWQEQERARFATDAKAQVEDDWSDL